jgi:hypothetical protein
MSSILLDLRDFYYNNITAAILKRKIRHLSTKILPQYEKLVEKHGAEEVVLIVSSKGKIEVWVTLNACREILDIHSNQRFYEMRKRHFPKNYTKKITHHLYPYDQIATLPSKTERRRVRQKWTGRMKTKLRSSPPASSRGPIIK